MRVKERNQEPGIMWADDSLRIESLNKTNVDNFEFGSGVNLEAPSFRDFGQMVVGSSSFDQNRLNCTESVLISPYFRSEAKKLRDQARSKIFSYREKVIFLEGVGPAGGGGFAEKQ